MDINKELSYRRKQRVTKVVHFDWLDSCLSYCPRCDSPIDIEYTKFCPYCGQKLSWKDFEKTKIIFK